MERLFLKYGLLIAGSLAAVFAQAQVSSRVADELFANKDYNAAAQHYQLIVDGKKTASNAMAPYAMHGHTHAAVNAIEPDVAVCYKLAECYFNLNDYRKAITYYEKIISLKDAKLYPLTKYRYAVSLRAMGKYDDAKQQLENFVKEYTKADEHLNGARQELENIAFIKHELDGAASNINSVVQMSGSIENSGSNFSAAYHSAGGIVFASTRPVGSDAGRFKSRLYYSGSGNPADATNIEIPADVNGHQAAPCLSPDGNTLLFTVWDTNEQGEKQSAIYASKKSGEQWAAAIKLDEKINVPGYSARQPYITEDGKYLLFVSDRPGGKGGFDIWYAAFDNGNTGVPINMGETINTSKNDESPFYHAPSKSLIFASNGRIGMGGYDLFTAGGTIGESFSEPKNMGYPVNSTKDDLYFANSGKWLGENAVISSDRGSECCLELFAVKLPKPAGPSPKTDTPVVAVESQPVKDTGLFRESETIGLRNIYFDYRSASLQPASFPQLDSLAAYLLNHPSLRVEIGAHTDGIGSTQANLKLSKARAQACVSYLLLKGVNKDRLEFKGYGECCPNEPEKINGKDNPKARERNRRVELKMLR